MTQRHNNSRMITVGADIIGEELTKNIAKEFRTVSTMVAPPNWCRYAK